MNIDDIASATAVLEELGRRLHRRRVARNLTQSALAREAGVAKRTVERVEAGESTQVITLVRVLRVLGLLSALDAALPDTGPRPMDLLKLRGRERQRASSKPRGGAARGDWSWGDES